MSSLYFSDNIIKFRHKKKITQEQLADFIGVTKASVSKWENKQSFPDILLLPRLASFFDITIDELLGYEPQLSKEQIRKVYHDLAAAFAKQPFEEVLKQSQDYVKRYYSCYPFLFQICVLWVNHFMLADNDIRKMEILKDIKTLCQHIIDDCKDIGICEDTMFLKSSVDLQLGNAKEACLVLEEMLEPRRLSRQSDTVLIQAYLSIGKKEKADDFAQISMFLHLISFITDTTEFLIVHKDNFDFCEEIICRILKVEEIYDINHLNPNIMANFYFQATIVYCIYKKKQDALKMLKQFTANVKYLLEDNHLSLHGDDYFNRLQHWYDLLDIGTEAPRDKKVIFDSLEQVLSHPLLAILEEEPEYQYIKKVFRKEDIL